jgi:Ca-activated chloride channel family protein
MLRQSSHIFLLLLAICLCNSVFAQNATQQRKTPLTRILFIYDASNSMNGRWESDVKMHVAQKLLSDAVDSLATKNNVEIALRVFGHQKDYRLGQDCNDTKLEVPFEKNNHEKLKNRLKKIKPQGTTLIAHSLEKAANDFPACSDCRNIIILITDGIEECGGDPCAVSAALQSRGIILKPFIIGIGLDMSFKKTFACIGNYYDASRESDFSEVLGIVISQALNTTTAQVNLIDVNNNASETDINFTLYDQFTGRPVYNFVHSFNAKGLPDTLNLEPLYTYRIVVHSIPQVVKDSIKLIPGKHNIIGIDCPQGNLIVKTIGQHDRNFVAPVIIRKAKDMNTLHTINLYQKEKLIVGRYDLEILSMPRIHIKDVLISQSHTTTVEIPNPGLCIVLKASNGFGDIYQLIKNEMVWVCNLDENSVRETIYLQPGNYIAVYRPLSAKGTMFTQERNFKIQSGQSTTVKF